MASASNIQALAERNKVMDMNYRLGGANKVYELPERKFGTITSEYKEKFIEWPIETLSLKIPYPKKSIVTGNGEKVNQSDYRLRYSQNEYLPDAASPHTSPRSSGINKLTKEQAPNLFAWSLQDKHANIVPHGRNLRYLDKPNQRQSSSP